MFKRLEDFRIARRVNNANRLLQIFLSITLVGALNYLAATHFDRWDLTSGGTYTLSAETMAWLDQVKRDPGKPLELVLILPYNMTDVELRARVEEVRSLMRQFAYTGRSLPHGPITIKTEEVDLLRQSARAKALKDRGLTEGTVMMVAYGDQQNFLNLTDLYDAVGGDRVAFKGENAVTSAIINLVRAKTEKVYFTVGHGEMNIEIPAMVDGLSKVAGALRLINYKPLSLNLASTEVPDDARVVVVVNPRLAEFQPEEVLKLRRYLEQKNGRVIILLEPGYKSGLDDLLSRWGMFSPDRVVQDLDLNSRTTENNLIVLGFSDHEIDRVLKSNLLLPVFGPTRPVLADLGAAQNDNRNVYKLLSTSPQGRAKQNPQSKTLGLYDYEGDIPIALITEQKGPDALGQPGGKLVVFGNADFVANQLFDSGGNSQLILNTVRYLTDHKDMLNIPPKPLLKLHLGISEAQFKGLLWRLAILPVSFLILGIVVFFSRYR